MVTNHRRDGGSDHFLAAVTKSFALNISVKMLTNTPATQGCNSRERVTPDSPAEWPREVPL